MALTTLAGTGGAAAVARDGPDARTYRPPVSSPVRDPFRPPPQPWLAGNRGIEYATDAGTPVRAIGPGVVTFAGMVAGERDVTVGHPDGLRSSYVDLATARVRVGDWVTAGEVVGLTTDRLHLGVRRGTTYLDPASLWGTQIQGGRVVLVPLHDRPVARSPTPTRRVPAGVGDGVIDGGSKVADAVTSLADLGR